MRKWRGNEWAILATLSLGFLMTMLDLTIVNIAIPAMRRELHASLAQIGWVLNAYIIVLAVLMISAGRLGDLRGRRRLFIAGVAVFTIASAASGLSQSGGELIAARVLQGLGAALLLPQTMAIIIATFPASRRGVALGIWGGVAGLATVAGPTIGGMLVTWLDWRWIFFVNLPVGLVAVVCAALILPDARGGRGQALDPPGVLLASAALVAITYGLIEGQAYGWGRVWSFVSIPLILAVGVVLLAVFLLLQARRQDRDPLLPFALFRDRNYALMSGANVMVAVGMIGMALPLTLYLQTVLGFSALRAGLTMAPLSLVSGLTAPFAGRIADRGGKFLVAAGFALYGGGLVLIAVVATATTPWYDLSLRFVVRARHRLHDGADADDSDEERRPEARGGRLWRAEHHAPDRLRPRQRHHARRAGEPAGGRARLHRRDAGGGRGPGRGHAGQHGALPRSCPDPPSGPGPPRRAVNVDQRDPCSRAARRMPAFRRSAE